MHEEMKISDYLNKNHSDKCIIHTYHYAYDSLLGAFDREGEWDILESGVEKGGSLCAWKEYFPNARVTGVDIVDQRWPEFKRDDVEFVLEDIKKYKPDRKFDFIIEDGNHSNHDALWSGVHLVEHLKDNGFLIIEDVQEGFMTSHLLWGMLNGDYVLNTVDMRRLTHTRDNVLIIIHKVKTNRVKTAPYERNYTI